MNKLPQILDYLPPLMDYWDNHKITETQKDQIEGEDIFRSEMGDHTISPLKSEPK